MDWLDATTAALAIIAVPLALRYPLHGKDDAASCDSCDSCDCAATHRSPTIQQEEKSTPERHPDPR